MRILGTDHCVEMLLRNRAVARRRGEVADAVVTTWVTAGELHFGAAKSGRPDPNRRLVTVKARLEASGRRIPDADLWIAAAALTEAAVLVTGNERHYTRIPGLRIESWIPRK